MLTIVRIIASVLVFTGLSVGISALRRGQVENVLTEGVTATLLKEVPGLHDEPGWEVSFVGEQGVVHGRIGSRELLETTTAAIARIERGEVAALRSVGRLYNGLRFREPAMLSLNGLRSGVVRVEGTLSAAFTEELRQALPKALPEGMQVDDRLRVHREVNVNPWGPALLEFLPEFFRQAEGCRLTIEDNRVTLGGVVASEQEKQRLGELTVSRLGEGFSFFDNRLGVVSERAPARLTIHFSAPEYVRLTGVLPSMVARDALLARFVARMSGTSSLTEEIQIDRRVEDPVWIDTVAGLLPMLAKYAMSADLAIDGAEVEVSAEAVSDRGKAELGAMIAQLFPASAFRVADRVSVAEGGGLRAIASVEEPVLSVARALPVAAPAAPVPPAAADAALREMVSGTRIHFKINSAELSVADISRLKTIAQLLATTHSRRVVLRGFTDQWGNVRLNRALARKRCDSVGAILRLHGADEDQVRIEPWSEALVSSGGDEPGWKKRRVEMELESIASALAGPLAEGAFEVRRPGL